MKVKLVWTDTQTGQCRQTIQNIPIAFGRGFAQMPVEIDGKSIVRIVLVDPAVSIFHALLNEENGQLVLIDQKSTNGTFVNGLQQEKCQLLAEEIIQIGRYQIQVEILATGLSHFSSKNRSSSRFQSRQTEEFETMNELDFYESYSSFKNSSNSFINCDNNLEEPDFYPSPFSDIECASDYQQNIDFTEADSSNLELEIETDFEQDMGAS